MYQDELDWRDLIRKPEKLFGYSYFYVFAILVVVGLLYVGRLTDIGKNTISDAVLADSSAFIKDIPLQAPRTIPPVDVLKAGVSTPEAIAAGRALFKTNCVSCHGDNGQGDGPSGLLLNPRPRNFQSLNGWTNGSKISQIYKTLEEGIVKNGMASYSYLSPADRFSLIHFVRSLSKGQPLDTPEELKGLDAAYQLSNGMNIPGQIPIKKATERVTRENANNATRVAAAMLQSETQPGVILLRRIASDEQKAITSLMHFKRTGTINELVRMISVDPVQVGFKAETTRLTAAEWKTLHQYTVTLQR
jgi:mono/diheme cytochrome c family protein